MIRLIAHNHYFNACPDTAWQSIVVLPDDKLFFPTAFSPNGDNHNDWWMAKGEGLEQVEIQIFDRWGKLITVLNNLSDRWDGTFRGKAVPEGVYLFSAKALTFEKFWIERSGSITLIR